MTAVLDLTNLFLGGAEIDVILGSVREETRFVEVQQQQFVTIAPDDPPF